ncbi:hypothetical protein J7E20_08265 [Bacillus sp. ISL-26]|uniref:hypothetical protein n=1 Tax=Bacillus sp. ISL-26 TaxID=2819119 RepID=UPI001BE52453|nr:hypothetical protein [Bacillus sp. ISL-26]MBT2634558.1 hypothetical protein [Bacillus sp. ISL-26]
MKITVDEQTKKFYLAFNEWVPVAGHEIKVGKYRFCAVPILDYINISEATSGTSVLKIKITPEVYMMTTTKKEAVQFLKGVGSDLVKIIKKHKKFEKKIEEARRKTLDKLGQMPPIEVCEVEGAE